MSTIISLHKKNAASETQQQPQFYSELSYELQVYADSIVDSWYDHITLLNLASKNTADSYYKCVKAILKDLDKAVWQLDMMDFPSVVKMRGERRNKPLAPSTVGGYACAMRSLQSYVLERSIANAIAIQTSVQVSEFINEENSIPVKRAKSNLAHEQWALSPELIVQIEELFIYLIKQAHETRSKSLYSLIRDRVIFHIGIHFALRISEIENLSLKHFSSHHGAKMRETFGNYGLLEVTGKNNVTGSIPMREVSIYNMLIHYIENVRPMLLNKAIVNRHKAREQNKEGYDQPITDLLFFSERGTPISANSFRGRLKTISVLLSLPKRVTPHTLRHTGCTLMAPIYSPEVAQRYMRHKNLGTTLGYYHSDPFLAGTHENVEYDTSLWNADDEDY